MTSILINFQKKPKIFAERIVQGMMDEELIIDKNENNKESVDSKLGPKPKRPMSAYFHFMIDKSKEGTYSKKEIGELWGLMDGSLKQKFIQMADAEKRAYMEWIKEDELRQKDIQAHRLANPKATNELFDKNQNDNLGDIGGDNFDIEDNQQLIPQHRIKAILKSDEDASRNLKANSLKYYTMCAELFGKWLVDKTAQDVKSKKKKKLALANMIDV